MKSFIDHAHTYASFYQKHMARYVQTAGMPFFLLSLMILFGFVHVVIPGIMDLHLACLGTLVLLVYYFMLQWQLALLLTPILLFLLWVAQLFGGDGPSSFSCWSFIILLILGGGAYIAGYVIEEKYPSLKAGAWQLLVAPMCLLAELFFQFGYMSGLRKELHHGKRAEHKKT